MSGTTITRSEAANVERWRQGQLGYEASSRRGARRAGIVFTLILTVLGAWLCLQFLSLQLWAWSNGVASAARTRPGSVPTCQQNVCGPARSL